ncbi:MAG TPA: DUF3108 domain-containing protein [Gammaproteobacteria bacterium]|nr:DUF3108 domain-containing protein [Gammaproteobacteria bacterium]HIL19191.1 DUF3108 domain-containing protein [Gammaproteobacteria bacterium]
MTINKPKTYRDLFVAPYRRLIHCLGISTLLALIGIPLAAADTLLPYDAVYEVSRSGLTAQRRIELRLDGETYTLVATTTLTGLLALTGRGPIIEESRFVLEKDRIRPLRYQLEDGSDNRDKDIQINFDWPSGKSHGYAKGKQWQFPLISALLDPLTFQLAARRALMRGERTPVLHVHEGDRIRRYDFIEETTQTIQMGQKPIDTIRYFVDRESKRRLYYWLAPTLDYLPIRLEQRHHKKLKILSILVDSSQM